jgi:hypothetical protein
MTRRNAETDAENSSAAAITAFARPAGQSAKRRQIHTFFATVSRITVSKIIGFNFVAQ